MNDADQFLQPAQAWANALWNAAVYDRIRGSDSLALYRLRVLADVKCGLEAGYAHEAVPDARQGPASRQTRIVRLSRLDPVSELLADQERRAAEPIRNWMRGANFSRIRNPAARIAARIADLDQVDIQSGDNPGYGPVDRDPRVLALIGEGPAAVLPLCDCLERDRRLTRTVRYWRFFTHHDGMVPVTWAAAEALRGILGPSRFEAISSSLELDVNQLSETEQAKRLAGAVRQYWSDPMNRTLNRQLEAALERFEDARAAELIRSGADLRTISPKGETVLMVAARAGKPELAARALKAGVAVNIRSLKGRTALMDAVYSPKARITRMLLVAGAEVDARDEFGDSPLSDAVLFGHADVVRVLLEFGADARLANHNGETPLSRAAEAQKLQKLLQQRAKP